MERDRRKFDRYLFNNDDFYLSIDLSLNVYKVKDISQGGLSFQYYPNSNKKLTDNYINIKIIREKKIEWEQDSCSIVYDISSLLEGQSLSGKNSRQCGIKFPSKITTKEIMGMQHKKILVFKIMPSGTK